MHMKVARDSSTNNWDADVQKLIPAATLDIENSSVEDEKETRRREPKSNL